MDTIYGIHLWGRRQDGKISRETWSVQFWVYNFYVSCRKSFYEFQQFLKISNKCIEKIQNFQRIWDKSQNAMQFLMPNIRASLKYIKFHGKSFTRSHGSWKIDRGYRAFSTHNFFINDPSSKICCVLLFFPLYQSFTQKSPVVSEFQHPFP